MKMLKHIVKKMKKRNWAVIAMNAMALMVIIQNVNSACVWIDGQPEVPEEAKRFKNSRS